MADKMTAEEKARKLSVPTFRDIASDFGGLVTVGDVATIVGQRMYDMLLEMHNWTVKQCADNSKVGSGA